MLDDAALDRKAEKLAEDLFDLILEVTAWKLNDPTNVGVPKDELLSELQETIKEIMLGART